MKNRKLLLIVSIVLALTMSLGGTLAYLTDTDADVNTMVLGNVKIVQNEQQRVEIGNAGAGLEEFEDGQVLLPAVYELVDAEGNKIADPAREVVNVNGYKITYGGGMRTFPNYMDKIVTVTNTGTTDAYVRTIFAVPAGLEANGGNNDDGDDGSVSQQWLHYNCVSDTDTEPANGWYYGDSLADDEYPALKDQYIVKGVELFDDGKLYDITIVTNKNAIPKNITTGPNLVGLYLDNENYTFENGTTGKYSTVQSFKGTFDGNGHTISNFYQNTWEIKGDYLDNRTFSPADLKLMIDAIKSSKFLSEAKTEELVEGLRTLCSRYQAQSLRRDVIVPNRVKNMNSKIHNNVEFITTAINEGVQVKFRYFDYNVKQERVFRKKGAFYTVSPYNLIYSDDNYYLLAYDAEQEDFRPFRVDRMANCGLTDLRRAGEEALKGLNLENYQRYTFNMYGGETKEVTLRFRNNMMNTVIDKFGRQNYAIPVDKDHFEVTVTVAVSPQFYGWVFGLKNYVTIVSPPDVVKGMAKHVEAVGKRYGLKLEKEK